MATRSNESCESLPHDTCLTAIRTFCLKPLERMSARAILGTTKLSPPLRKSLSPQTRLQSPESIINNSSSNNNNNNNDNNTDKNTYTIATTTPTTPTPTPTPTPTTTTTSVQSGPQPPQS
eukprot:5096149-Amphidinium_carterae.1